MADLNRLTIESWETKRRGNTPPFRFEFPELDADVHFLISYDPINGHKIRASGLFFDGLMGSSVVGRTLSSLFETDDRKQVDANIERVFSGPAMVTLQLETASQPHEIVLLPIRAENGPITFALCAINILEMPAFGTPKLMLKGAHIKEIREEIPKNAVGFAEEKSGFQHKSPNQFRVIEGNPALKTTSARLGFEIIKNVKREP